MRFDLDCYCELAVMHCKTEKDAKVFLKCLDRNGYKWHGFDWENKKVPLSLRTNFDVYGESTVYCFDPMTKLVQYSNLERYLEEGFPVIEFDNYEWDKDCNVVCGIKDSGERREFDSGAVRDIQDGKGRCDLLPLDIVCRIPLHRSSLYTDSILQEIGKFQESGNAEHLLYCILRFSDEVYENHYEMLLELSKHFEDGAKKYSEENWKLGINTKCYIDSAVRHYLKYKAGWIDEPHNLAFLWNLVCCIWTCEHKPELNDYAKEEQK